jgi:hypothetical protein
VDLTGAGVDLVAVVVAVVAVESEDEGGGKDGSESMAFV